MAARWELPAFRTPSSRSSTPSPGINQSDLLVINKTDLAPLIGADLDVMARDSRRMRGDGPFVFAQVTNGVGVDTITGAVVEGLEATRARPA